MPYDITYVWNLKYDTNEPIYETETNSQTERASCSCQGGWVEGRIGLGLAHVSYYTQDE